MCFNKWGLFEYQLRAGLKLLRSTDELDQEMITELLELSNRIDNDKFKYQLYEITSKFYTNEYPVLALALLDSAYKLRNSYYNEEMLREIGKAESDLQYQLGLKDAREKESVATNRFYYILLFAIVLLLLFLLILKFYRDRKKTLIELKDKNKIISDQKAKLETLVNAKDKLLGIIGHDLRNPIKEFKLSTRDIIQKELEPTMRTNLEYLADSADNLELLLNSLLNYADTNLNIVDKNKEYLSLRSLIDTTLLLNRSDIESKNINIEYDLSIDHVNTNLNVASLVLRNVIHNAIKFSHVGGTIKFHSTTEDEFTILKISDQGIGMSQVDIDKLENYIRPSVQDPINAPKGSGFGLLTAKEQFEQIGGSIYVESKVGAGTTLILYF